MTHTVAGKRKLGAWEKLVAYYTAPVVKFNTYTVSKGSLLDQSEFLSLKGLPDNCAPYVIIYTGAQLSGSGAQLSGPGAQLSGRGAQLSAILVCIPTHVREILQQYIYESDQGLVAAGYSIYIYIYYRYSNESKTLSHKN